MVPQDYRAGMLIGFCVQHLLKAWKEPFSWSPFTVFSKAMAPYMLFLNSTN